MTDEQLQQEFRSLRAQIARIPDPPGHFWILLLLLLIAFKTGACR